MSYRGKSGGLGLLWKEELEVHILSYFLHHIDAEIGGMGDKEHWYFIGFMDIQTLRIVHSPSLFFQTLLVLIHFLGYVLETSMRS